jgi:hypothetical protein
MIKIYKEGCEFNYMEVISTNKKGHMLVQPDFVQGIVLLTVAESKGRGIAEIEVSMADLFEMVRELQTYNV